MFKFVNFLLVVVSQSMRYIEYWIDLFCLVANSASDIEYGWRLGNNKSVSFDTKVRLSQFDLIRYPQFDEFVDINGRMSISIIIIQSFSLVQPFAFPQ